MVEFGLEASAGGAVRKCEPFDLDNTCPSCDTGGGAHKAEDGFILRTCRNCTTTWRELPERESI